MSSLFNSISFTDILIEPTLVYTASSDNVIMSFILNNSHFGKLPVNVYIKRGDDIINLAVNTHIESGKNLDVLSTSKMAIKQNDKFYISCPIPNVITGVLSMYQDI